MTKQSIHLDLRERLGRPNVDGGSLLPELPLPASLGGRWWSKPLWLGLAVSLAIGAQLAGLKLALEESIGPSGSRSAGAKHTRADLALTRVNAQRKAEVPAQEPADSVTSTGRGEGAKEQGGAADDTNRRVTGHPFEPGSTLSPTDDVAVIDVSAANRPLTAEAPSPHRPILNATAALRGPRLPPVKGEAMQLAPSHGISLMAPSVARKTPGLPPAQARPASTPVVARLTLAAQAQADGSVAWLLQQPPGAFALQLASMREAERLDTFIRQHQLTGSLVRYPATKRGMRWMVLVQTGFASRGEADAAAAKLAKTKRIKAWVRLLRDIQSEVDTSSLLTAMQ